MVVWNDCRHWWSCNILLKNDKEKCVIAGFRIFVSKVSWKILTSLNPTLNFQTNDYFLFPFIIDKTRNSSSITENV